MVQVKTYGGSTAAPVPVIKLVDTPPVVVPPTPTGTPPQVTKPSTLIPSRSVEFPILTNGNVFQCVQYEPKRNEYYVTQAGRGTNGLNDPYQSTVITRTTGSGKVLDMMRLNDAGHGSMIGVENTNNKIFIWLTWNRQLDANSTPYDFVRVPYLAGKWDRASIPGVVKLHKYTTGYALNSFDWENNWLMERKRSGSIETFKRRKISDIVKGVDATYGSFSVTVSVLQGWCTVNDYAFVYTGSPNGERLSPPDPAKLSVYRWTDGTLYDTVNLSSLGINSDGSYYGDKHEPESVSMYRDPQTGIANVQVGVTLGQPGDHRWIVWTYYGIGAPHTQAPFIVTQDTFGVISTTDVRVAQDAGGVLTFNDPSITVNNGVITA